MKYFIIILLCTLSLRDRPWLSHRLQWRCQDQAVRRHYVQSQALRLAIARALVKVNAEDKKALRAEGFITRDSRVVERKKPGQPKARRKFQFSKR